MKKSFLYLFLIIILLSVPGTSVFAADIIDSPYDFGLKDYYPPLTGGDMKQVYRQIRSEYPDEVPVVMPRKVSGATEIFVSPKGSDMGSGTIDDPLETLDCALEYVSGLDYSKRLKGVVIYLRGGNYIISNTVKIGAKMSGTKNAPLFISAYNDEEVVLSPSVIIPADKFSMVSDSKVLNKLSKTAKNAVVEADLSKLGITGIDEIPYTNMSNPSSQPTLYWDDYEMQLARWPNGSYNKVGKVIDTGPVRMVDGMGSVDGFKDDGRGFEFVVKENKPFSWENTGDIYFYGFMYWQWNPGTYKVKSFDGDNRSVRTVNYSTYGVRENSQCEYYFFNVLEELDMPGEWYIDKKTNKLYLYPVGDIKEAKIALCTNGVDLFSVNKAKHVYFNGITLSYNSKSGFIINDSENIVVQNCNLEFLKENGILMSGSSYSGATTTQFYNVTDNMIKISDSRSRAQNLNPARNFVQNCFFSRQNDSSHASAIIGGSVGDVYSHNLFQKFAAAAATPRGNETVFEYNEITASPYEVTDMGAVYTSGFFGLRQDRFNYIHDMSANVKMGHAIYYDTFGTHFIAYGNIINNMAEGIYTHGGQNNAFVNNVIANVTKPKENAFMSSYNFFNPSTRTWPGLVPIPNSYGVLGSEYRGETNTLMSGTRAQRLPMIYKYINDMYEYRYISQAKNYVRGSFEDDLRRPSNLYIENNVSYKHGAFNMEPVGMDTVIGLENNLVTNENPGFKDPDNGNFNLNQNSKINKLLPGFEDIPFDSMGLIKGTRWDSLKVSEPVLLNPANNSNGTEKFDAVAFGWKPVYCSGRYKITVASDAEFKNIIFEKEIDNAGIQAAVPEMGAKYYWKVTAYPMAKSINQEPCESEVYSFTTMTYEETKLFSDGDTQYLEAEINYSQKFADRIIEGTQVGEYAPGTKAAIYKAIGEANNVLKNETVQIYIDNAVQKLKGTVNKQRENIVSGFVKLDDFTLNGWSSVNNTDGIIQGGEIADKVTAENGIVTMECKEQGYSQVMYNKQLEMGIMYAFRMKLASIEQWPILSMQEEPNVNWRFTNNYALVIQQGTIELQKYTPDKMYSIVQSVENNGVYVQGDTWHDYACGSFATKDGVRVVIMIDGKIVIDYLDTNADAIYGERYFVTFNYPVDKMVQFAASAFDYKELP